MCFINTRWTDTLQIFGEERDVCLVWGGILHHGRYAGHQDHPGRDFPMLHPSSEGVLRIERTTWRNTTTEDEGWERDLKCRIPRLKSRISRVSSFRTTRRLTICDEAGKRQNKWTDNETSKDDRRHMSQVLYHSLPLADFGERYNKQWFCSTIQVKLTVT